MSPRKLASEHAVNWTRKGSQQVYENQWIRVVEHKVSRPDGAEGIYAVVETKAQAVTIVAIDENKRICLINEYRFPVDRRLWRLPTGGAGHEDNPSIDSAKAELLEEAGLTAERWALAGETVTMSGLSQEVSHVYVATEISGSPHECNDPDVSEVAFFTVPELIQMIRDGTLIDGQSLSALVIALTSQDLAFVAASV